MLKEPTTVQLVEVTNEGLIKLIGKTVLLFCCNYNYTGKLIGVNTDSVLLSEPAIVFETGPFSATSWKDAQRLPSPEWYVMRSLIESAGAVVR